MVIIEPCTLLHSSEDFKSVWYVNKIREIEKWQPICWEKVDVSVFSNQGQEVQLDSIFSMHSPTETVMCIDFLSTLHHEPDHHRNPPEGQEVSKTEFDDFLKAISHWINFLDKRLS